MPTQNKTEIDPRLLVSTAQQELSDTIESKEITDGWYQEALQSGEINEIDAAIALASEASHALHAKREKLENIQALHGVAAREASRLALDAARKEVVNGNLTGIVDAWPSTEVSEK